jgi:hypothetical protein
MQKQLEKIERIIHRLDDDGILDNLTGNCVLAADIFQSLLNSEGLQTRIVECELMITRLDPETGMKNVRLVGYNVTPDNSQVATHVVLVTQADPPVLIDASIGEYIGFSKHVVASVLTKEADPDIFCRTKVGNGELIYKIKKNIKLPNFHQRDLIARLQQEVDTNKRVDRTQRWVYWAVVITAINFFLNMLQITMKLIGQ